MASIYKNGQYYIGGSGGGIDYSTEEQDTGLKWIDKKPIYQKTVDIGALPNATVKNVAHGISNLGYCVQLFGMVKSTNDMLILPAVATNAAYQTYVGIDGTDIKLSTAINLSDYSGYITVRYTKTTD